MRLPDLRLPLSLLLALSVGCGGSSTDSDSPSADAPAAATSTTSAVTAQGGSSDDLIPALSGAAAKVNGEEITYAQLDEKASAKLVRLRTQAYEIRKQTLDELIDTRLLEAEAKKRGVSVDDLVKTEVEAKAPEITDEEARAFFEKNPPRGNVDFDRMKDRIKDYLGKKNTQDARTAFIGSLREAAGVEIFLEPMRFDVTFSEADPIKGANAAPIQIVEYSDFQCPYCSRVNPTLEQVAEKYGDKVAVAFRNFPLPMHKEAPRAGEASYCAQDQGKFWEYHDVLFENQRAQKDEDLKKYAGEVGLDAAKFDECLASNKYADRVADDKKSGEAAGVSGTPAFFVNGVFINGARPFEAFADVIDDELKRKNL
ncbi:MAG: thioredoxin domain-containing protein [Deltaproteobacteria bacterium]|nr:thioredoxin domain-containing protein [Deltaproteobacteria bacterium]